MSKQVDDWVLRLRGKERRSAQDDRVLVSVFVAEGSSIGRENNLSHTKGAVAVLADDDVGCAEFWSVLLHCLFWRPGSVYEEDYIGILLNGAGLTQVRKHDSLALPCVNASVQLRKCQYGNLEFLGQDLESARNLPHL